MLLFREDLSGAYLTLAQGVTEPGGRLGRAGMVAHLESVAFEVRRQSPELGAAGFSLDSALDLRTTANLGRNYEHSVIAHKLYEKGQVPNDDEILRDLEARSHRLRPVHREPIDGRRSSAAAGPGRTRS